MSSGELVQSSRPARGGGLLKIGWPVRGRTRVYLATAAVAGIAALIVGLVLANGQAEHQPVIAVETASGASSQQVHAMVASSQAHHAGMVLLYTSTWQRAEAVMKALSGYRSSVDVSVLVSSSGRTAIASELPATAQVIDANGNLVRAGVTPGGPGLLVGLWACLLLLFAFLVTRFVAQLRTPGGHAEPVTTTNRDGPPVRRQRDEREERDTRDGRNERNDVKLLVAPPPPAGDILVRYLPQDPVARWEPQCPRCGAAAGAAGAAASANGFDCQSCGYRWPAAGPAEWPDVVLNHRRRRDGQPTSAN